MISSDKPVTVVMKSHKGEDVIQLFDAAKDQIVMSQERHEPELAKPDKMDKKTDPAMTEIQELKEKWNFNNLQRRFMERIENHIKYNENTKS